MRLTQTAAMHVHYLVHSKWKMAPAVPHFEMTLSGLYRIAAEE